jgi:hypothetical protein
MTQSQDFLTLEINIRKRKAEIIQIESDELALEKTHFFQLTLI